MSSCNQSKGKKAIKIHTSFSKQARTYSEWDHKCSMFSPHSLSTLWGLAFSISTCQKWNIGYQVMLGGYIVNAICPYHCYLHEVFERTEKGELSSLMFMLTTPSFVLFHTFWTWLVIRNWDHQKVAQKNVKKPRVPVTKKPLLAGKQVACFQNPWQPSTTNLVPGHIKEFWD